MAEAAENMVPLLARGSVLKIGFKGDGTSCCLKLIDLNVAKSGIALTF